jgi:hypothetical protein
MGLPRRLLVCLVLASAFHLPLTPLARFGRLGRMFLSAEREADYVPRTDPVPIEVFEPPPPDKGVAPDLHATQSALEPAAPGKSAPTKPAAEFERVRADENANAKRAATAEAAATALEEKKLERAGLAGLGDAKGPKANISLALWVHSVSEPLRTSLGRLLACNPEMRSIMQTGVDVGRDVDGLVIVTNQVNDGNRATVAIQHRLDAKHVHAALDVLVKAAGESGAWTDARSARLGADDSAKVAVALPGKDGTGVVFLAPRDAHDRLRKIHGPASIPEPAGRVVSLTLRQPAVLARRLGLILPSRLSELVLDVFDNSDGSLDARFDFEDDSPGHAEEDAPVVGERLGAALEDLGAVASALGAALTSGVAGGSEPVTPLSFGLSERRFVGMLHVPSDQSQMVLGLVMKLGCPKERN